MPPRGKGFLGAGLQDCRLVRWGRDGCELRVQFRFMEFPWMRRLLVGLISRYGKAACLGVSAIMAYRCVWFFCLHKWKQELQHSLRKTTVLNKNRAWLRRTEDGLCYVWLVSMKAVMRTNKKGCDRVGGIILFLLTAIALVPMIVQISDTSIRLSIRPS